MAWLPSEEYGGALAGYIGRAAGGPLRGVLAVDAAQRGAARPRSDGGYQWLRSANDEPDRAERRALCATTRRAAECRGYVLAGQRAVLLRHVSACVAGTRLVSPSVGAWPVCGFLAGEGADVWSSGRGEWLPCLVRAVYPRRTEEGGCVIPPDTVKVESEAGTQYVRQGAIPQELRRADGQAPAAPGAPPAAWQGRPTELSVRRGVVLGVAVELCREGRRCAAVNAASAYHAGGGFTSGGRHALEEAMCSQSTLFESLAQGERLAEAAGVAAPAWARPRARRDGSAWQCHLPDDGASLSPLVEVFRQGSNEGYAFEGHATRLEAVVSVAMPNCNERMGDSPVDAHPLPEEYEAQLRRRWRAALTAAAYWTEADCLVVPDAGCGVFRNPPGSVGRAFAQVLRQEFMGRFADVVIAFPGGPAGEEFASAAMQAFQSPQLPQLPKAEAAELPKVDDNYVWEFSVRSGYEPFAPHCQAMVEAKYQVFLSLTPSLRGSGAIAKIPMNDTFIIVDFIKWTQHLEGSSRERMVQRRKLS